MRRSLPLLVLLALAPVLAASTAALAKRKAKAAAHKGKKRPASKARPSAIASRPDLAAELRGGAANAAPRGVGLERDLQDAIDLILAKTSLKRAINGLYLIDVGTGRVLYSFAADRQLNPASNVKLVSTAAALDALGGGYAYRTRVLGPAADRDGVVRGDVHLVGSSDPTLRIKDLAELASLLRANGVQRIEGDLIVSGGPRREVLARPTLEITVVGGANEKSAPRVSVFPASDLFQVRSSVRTTRKKRGARVGGTLQVSKDGQHIVVNVSGRVRTGRKATLYRQVPKSALFAGYTLRNYLETEGIVLTGGIRREEQPHDGGIELASHHSRPLAAITAAINKPSNNFLADRVILTVGAELYGGEPTLAKAVKAMDTYLAKLGIETGTFRLDNGSGLSYTNHMSARQIVQVLMGGFRDGKIAPDYVASLSIAGQDGTLGRRLRGHPSAGYVRGKTGTLTGVAALSGFVNVGTDDTLCFAIVTNGFGRRAKGDVRSAHHAIVDEMVKYLSARSLAGLGDGDGKPAPLPLPGVAAATDDVGAEEEERPTNENGQPLDTEEPAEAQLPTLRPF